MNQVKPMSNSEKTLIELMEKLIDYTLSMKAATGYKCPNEPDLCYMLRITQAIKRRN